MTDPSAVSSRSADLPARPVRGGRRVYLECTSTYASRYHTGIQRASRNLVEALLKVRGPSIVTPVIHDGRRLIAIDALPRAAGPRSERNATDRLRGGFHRARAATLRIVPSRALRNLLHSQRLEFGLRSLVHGATNLRRRLKSTMRPSARVVKFHASDVLVLLDPSWSVDLSRELARARAAGATIWVVVYDLIPLLRPDLAPEGSSLLMDKWLRRALRYADGLLGISRCVADDLKTHLARRDFTSPVTIDYFYLGADLNAQSASLPLDGVARACAGPPGCVFLIVGTIEPRKNHALVLAAFDRLWAQGLDVRLLVFGRLGWRSDELARHLRGHSEYGHRLFWMDSGTDSELDYAYRHASALIFASLSEGFGLPLVEAMRYGLPVIASDIPVFRELGLDYPTYFDFADPASLEGAIRAHLAGGTDTKTDGATPRAWLSWVESAQMLLAKVTSDAHIQASTRSRAPMQPS